MDYDAKRNKGWDYGGIPEQSFLLPQTSDHNKISLITGELKSEPFTHITQIPNLNSF